MAPTARATSGSAPWAACPASTVISEVSSNVQDGSSTSGAPGPTASADLGIAAGSGGQYRTCATVPPPSNVITLSERGSPSASAGAYRDATLSRPAASISRTVNT